MKTPNFIQKRKKKQTNGKNALFEFSSLQRPHYPHRICPRKLRKNKIKEKRQPPSCRNMLKATAEICRRPPSKATVFWLTHYPTYWICPRICRVLCFLFLDRRSLIKISGA